jgi:hypothetical protein
VLLHPGPGDSGCWRQSRKGDKQVLQFWHLAQDMLGNLVEQHHISTCWPGSSKFQIKWTTGGTVTPHFQVTVAIILFQGSFLLGMPLHSSVNLLHTFFNKPLYRPPSVWNNLLPSSCLDCDTHTAIPVPFIHPIIVSTLLTTIPCGEWPAHAPKFDRVAC